MKKNILLWSPRILAVLAILFMMMFSLDCFGPEYSFKEKMICLLMHNIPALIIAGVLVLAWKWELIGGILFILVSIAGAIYFNGFGSNWGVLPIMAPFLIVGILFLVYHFVYNKKEIKD
jgi:hypothetical protein